MKKVMYNNQYYEVPDWARYIGKRQQTDCDVFVYEVNPIGSGIGIEYRVQKVGLDIWPGVVPC